MHPDRPSRSRTPERRPASRVDRRTVLAGIGGVAVLGTAGCLGSVTGSGPRYSGYERKDLIPGAETFPDGWEERPDLNENFVVFGGPGDRVFVGLDADVLPDVDAAVAAFTETKSRMRRPEPHPLADQAFWDEVEGEYALTVFRHSNALGQAFALRESDSGVVPDRTRSQDYAERMYHHWQGL